MINQKEIKETEEKKKGRGGKRPNSGRKRRMEEKEIIEKLSPFEEIAFTKLRERIEANDIKALQIFFNYYLGQPTQRVESKIEGNLTSIAVEVVRPQLVDSQDN